MQGEVVSSCWSLMLVKKKELNIFCVCLSIASGFHFPLSFILL